MTDGEFESLIKRFRELYGRPHNPEEDMELFFIIHLLDCDEVYGDPKRVERLLAIKNQLKLPTISHPEHN